MAGEVEGKGYPDAIVRPVTAARTITTERFVAAPDLAGHVDYHWYVGWELEHPHDQQVIPQPRIHVAAEHGRLLVHGIGRRPFVRHLVGRGHTLGVSFLPGLFRPVLGSRVSAIADQVLPAQDLLGVDDRPAADRILSATEPREMVAAMESYLLEVGLPADPVADEVRGWVALAEVDRSITRAEQLADQVGLSLRSLQRLFSEYVGIGPKWVVQRFRVLEVAARAHSGEVDWAQVAAELDFSDQAHLVRTFRDVVGAPPATYARDL
ncbi:AraC-like DNA-binding protein [Nocardioides luteus]|uniref:AraC family transcriptional regulator n=1 Tax=Nocardioides luteus TaxID=1844 RepID=A0ABQ5T4H8_9ACTN|nr:helix-turn-helix domain-containing protein [Nocardioides luteus]MDR7308949.1 AraC-like DNA-binding protein [Nocardioides luteus]GGR63493.1 AraC family transcriptional regulator [Nocardioides luteus]GLJ70379.1 AraC family transcriptional regulator [Nocardioides luteus]